MWKKELKAQVTGTFDKRTRRGMRKPKEEGSGVLGKRERSSSSKSTKTSTDHKKNTSTFKS